jgi:hypothetical protein
MTVTVNDIKTHRRWTEEIDGAQWCEVSYGDQKFLLCAVDMTDEDVTRVAENDFPFVIVTAIEGIEAAKQLFLDTFPTKDTAVFPAVVGPDGRFEMKYECNEECATGVCKKRLASRVGVGDMDLAYTMLVDALNA